MKKQYVMIIACLLLALAGASSAVAQETYSVTGRVVWKAGKVSMKGKGAEMDGKPVVGAKVRMGPGNRTATTDANGNFTITGLPRSSYTMHIKAREHASMTKAVVVNENETLGDIKLVWKNYRIGGKGNRNVQG